ncbi:Microcompartments protein [Sodalis praecaptivus]|uniref:Microcompartments protein n=1 Tax=Sodalis praecaptivus TaxID=1239307 RepID=W0HYF8_9GAMM|nr:BMC domain-containing protein [Sodalis praecaptivus]AHF77183.1 Microcompartments protein [Sodalis praecaptivus]
MSGQSLGLIETVGLTVAVEAADAAMKSANVDLVGYELTKGGGLVTVKFTGDVGAMNAAVAAGVAAANRIGQVYAWKVIARTATGIDALIASGETGGANPAAPITHDKPAAEAHNEERIAVINLEPVASLSDCLAQREEVKMDASAPASSPAERVPAQCQDDAEHCLEKGTETFAQDDKKAQRAKIKGARR